MHMEAHRKDTTGGLKSVHPCKDMVSIPYILRGHFLYCLLCTFFANERRNSYDDDDDAAVEDGGRGECLRRSLRCCA